MKQEKPIITQIKFLLNLSKEKLLLSLKGNQKNLWRKFKDEYEAMIVIVESNFGN